MNETAKRNKYFKKAEKLDKTGKIDKSIKYYKKCLLNLENEPEFPYIAKCLKQIANYYIKRNEPDKAMKYIEAERFYYADLVAEATQTKVAGETYDKKKKTLSPQPNSPVQIVDEQKKNLSPRANSPVQIFDEQKKKLSPRPNSPVQIVDEQKKNLSPRPNSPVQIVDEQKKKLSPRPNSPVQIFDMKMKNVSPRVKSPDKSHSSCFLNSARCFSPLLSDENAYLRCGKENCIESKSSSYYISGIHKPLKTSPVANVISNSPIIMIENDNLNHTLFIEDIPENHPITPRKAYSISSDTDPMLTSIHIPKYHQTSHPNMPEIREPEQSETEISIANSAVFKKTRQVSSNDEPIRNYVFSMKCSTRSSNLDTSPHELHYTHATPPSNEDAHLDAKYILDETENDSFLNSDSYKESHEYSYESTSKKQFKHNFTESNQFPSILFRTSTNLPISPKNLSQKPIRNPRNFSKSFDHLDSNDTSSISQFMKRRNFNPIYSNPISNRIQTEKDSIPSSEQREMNRFYSAFSETSLTSLINKVSLDKSNRPPCSVIPRIVTKTTSVQTFDRNNENALNLRSSLTKSITNSFIDIKKLLFNTGNSYINRHNNETVYKIIDRNCAYCRVLLAIMVLLVLLMFILFFKPIYGLDQKLYGNINFPYSFCTDYPIRIIDYLFGRPKKKSFFSILNSKALARLRR